MPTGSEAVVHSSADRLRTPRPHTSDHGHFLRECGGALPASVAGMCAAAASTPWPSSQRASKLPVLDGDDVGFEPTVRAEFSFGQVTLPLRKAVATMPFPAKRGEVVKAHPRRRTPTPKPSVEGSIPTPMISPPPSATRAVAFGFMIGTSLGLAVLGAAWHFFL
jgi:hypothetical protein